MKDVKNITACVVDNGLFFGLAQVLSKQYGRVLYHFPGWERGFSSSRDGCIGDGFESVEYCPDIWREKNNIDLFIYPDIGRDGEQLELEQQGKLVWGSRTGSDIELLRSRFMDILKDVGLQVPTFKSLTGLTNLRLYLSQNKDKFVKISKWRGDMETWHHFDIELSTPKLDELAVRFGTLKETVPFLVFDPIDTKLEVGYDGYCVNGWYPDTAVHGIEKKDEGYFGAIQDYDDLPEQVREVNERMAPILEKHNYRNFWSTEIRIVGDKFFFIDPTCRAGMPSGDAQFILYDNLAEIILAGAAGEVVNPEHSHRFAAQALIKHNDDPDNWRNLQIPESMLEWVHLVAPVRVGDTYAISPSASTGDVVGSVLAVGDTIEETIQTLKEHAEALEDNPVSIHTDALMDVLKEMIAANEEGVVMTEDEIPDPAIAT